MFRSVQLMLGMNDCAGPLHWAAQEGRIVDVMALLAAPGIDVNKSNVDGSTPLHTAARNGRTEAVAALLAAPGIDVNKSNVDGSTPLHTAARNGRTEAVATLLAAPGIDANNVHNDGWTALHSAAQNGLLLTSCIIAPMFPKCHSKASGFAMCFRAAPLVPGARTKPNPHLESSTKTFYPN